MPYAFCAALLIDPCFLCFGFCCTPSASGSAVPKYACSASGLNRALDPGRFAGGLVPPRSPGSPMSVLIVKTFCDGGLEIVLIAHQPVKTELFQSRLQQAETETEAQKPK